MIQLFIKFYCYCLTDRAEVWKQDTKETEGEQKGLEWNNKIESGTRRGHTIGIMIQSKKMIIYENAGLSKIFEQSVDGLILHFRTRRSFCREATPLSKVAIQRCHRSFIHWSHLSHLDMRLEENCCQDTSSTSSNLCSGAILITWR